MDLEKPCVWHGQHLVPALASLVAGLIPVGLQLDRNRTGELVVLKTLILPLNDSSFEYGREEQRHELNIIVIY
jgi:hypothetical protein